MTRMLLAVQVLAAVGSLYLPTPWNRLCLVVVGFVLGVLVTCLLFVQLLIEHDPALAHRIARGAWTKKPAAADGADA